MRHAAMQPNLFILTSSLRSSPFAPLSLLSHTAIFVLCCVYYIAVFGDLCHHLNMPLLTVCRNVYCDGVYDLCHIGHKNLFKRALTYGNRLFVGVCNDEDCSNYKRPPIMTSAERCAEVAACKAVTKVSLGRGGGVREVVWVIYFSVSNF